MAQFRASLSVALGLIVVGLGAAAGCAKSGAVTDASPSHFGGSANAEGGTGAGRAGTGQAGDSSSSTGGASVVTCDEGLTRCGGSQCVDITNNSEHCGGCGRPCAAEVRACVAGHCTCPADTHAVCSGICTDLRVSLSNCGVCGNVCAMDRVCQGGTCVCDPAKKTTLCGNTCVDLMTDVFHCGACNTTTTPACVEDQVCSAGVCAAACTAPIVKCGPKCSDLQTDSAHCGDCNTACDSTRMCSAGKCVCATNRILCGTSTCADLQTDSNNCNACGTVCTPGTECSKGSCVCKADATKCTVPGTGGAGGAGGATGSIVCVDTTSHPAHCGACNSPCAGAESCVSSECTCVAPATPCGTPAICTDVMTSNAHCGGCGQACEATAHCESGACVCTAPNVQCGANCVDLSKSAAHCGDCNTACVGTQICSNSTCVSGDIRVYTKLSQLPATVDTKSTSIPAYFRVCNVGTSTVALPSATIVYWYSRDGAAGGEQTAELYSSTLTGVTTSTAAVSPKRGTTDYRAIVTLPATASLAPAGCINEINVTIHAGPQWPTGYLVANDWSYLAATDYQLNDKVTMYLAGTKIWGNEPQ
jgi:hypothetical protein